MRNVKVSIALGVHREGEEGRCDETHDLGVLPPPCVGKKHSCASILGQNQQMLG